MYKAHNYELMTEDKRPQDDYMDGRDWKFETLEHGGEYPDLMPQAIRATDAQGRSCIYLPVMVDGSVVDSNGFVTDSLPDARVVFNEMGVGIHGGTTQASERDRRVSLAADLQEYLYRIASQVPFEHAEWARQRGVALLAALRD